MSARARKFHEKRSLKSSKKLPPLKKEKEPSDRLETSLKLLSPRQLRAFRKIFDDFDLKKSGTLTAEELHVCVNKLAGYEALSFDEIMKILQGMDVNGTGVIEFDEFIYFMTRPQVKFN